MIIVVTESEYRKGESVFSSTNNYMKFIPVPDEESLLAERIFSLQVKNVNLYCTNTPDVVSQSVAELTLALFPVKPGTPIWFWFQLSQAKIY